MNGIPCSKLTALHRFTNELAAGTIDQDVMRRYLVEDHAFLDDFVRLYHQLAECHVFHYYLAWGHSETLAKAFLIVITFGVDRAFGGVTWHLPRSVYYRPQPGKASRYVIYIAALQRTADTISATIGPDRAAPASRWVTCWVADTEEWHRLVVHAYTTSVKAQLRMHLLRFFTAARELVRAHAPVCACALARVFACACVRACVATFDCVHVRAAASWRPSVHLRVCMLGSVHVGDSVIDVQLEVRASVVAPVLVHVTCTYTRL
eukprot:2865645-Pleurochrysis_carterae.AAC.1